MNAGFRFTMITLCMIALTGIASAATVANFSFEIPSITVNQYNPLDPTPGGWTFSGRSGIALNTWFTPPPPDGSQAAFLQQYLDQPSSLTDISQTLSGLNLASHILTFALAQRPSFSANPITVFYGSQNLGTFTPSSTTFQTFTVNFTPGAASGVLSFRSAATTTGDIGSSLDKVTLTEVGPSAVPEPTTGLLIFGALAGLFIVRRRQHC